jgi:hypothetical protein
VREVSEAEAVQMRFRGSLSPAAPYFNEPQLFCFRDRLVYEATPDTELDELIISREQISIFAAAVLHVLDLEEVE